jgi:hypothetical protein
MKIAICIPSRDTVHAGFALCLSKLTARLQKDNIDFEVLLNLGSVIASQRNQLVQTAIDKNFTHILWLDSDMHFPASVVDKLLKHDKDVVAAAYTTRVKPQRSVAFLDEYDLDKRLSATFGLHKVFAVGLGCMLTNIEIYKTLPKPWFQYLWDEQLQELCGEDIYFCKQLKDNGFMVWVDGEVSEMVAHFGTKAFMMKDVNEST